MAKIKVILDEEDLNMLITEGEPPPDAVGVRMLVEAEDGKDHEVLRTYQKVCDKTMYTRIVAKFWMEHLGEYHPPN